MGKMVLKDYAITHGGIRQVRHPELGVDITGETAIRYLRFKGPVKLERLELARSVYGRLVPYVPTHPAHLIISVLDRQTNHWRLVRTVDLPADPRTIGEGLSQGMAIEEMEEHFQRLLQDPPYVIDLGGLETDHLRVECDEEHPVWPSHGEMNGGRFDVPFGILHPLRAFGTPLWDGKVDPVYLPICSLGEIQPSAPLGMNVQLFPHEVRFVGSRLSVGFSLRRPMLMHLGWDVMGQGQAQQNRLLVTKTGTRATGDMGGLSGPTLRTLSLDAGPQLWTGEVSVRGNQVIYRNLHYIEGLTIDAVFTVEADRLLVALTQSCAQAAPVIEAEAWRLAWDMKAGITGAVAMPTLAPGRNGDVQLPMLWASDGVGCLACRMVEGEPSDDRLQVESYHDGNCVTGGFNLLGARPDPDGCLVVPAGRRQAVYEIAVAKLEPLQPAEAAPLSAGVARHWATVFACFRPEHRGFSNNAVSCNCHVSQGVPLEIVAHTRRPENGPDPLALARFTIERALLDGGGYGYCRNLYLDSDPVLVSGAGRIHQAEPDLAWLRRIEPGLVATTERLLANLNEDGLVLCRDLSGNSGSFRWSTNAMDVVGVGHIDAYANAWAYRAFCNASALLGELGRSLLARRCRDAANALRTAYRPALVNPDTGWVAGWRSRDGELHDYAFLWVNGVALAFGLLDHEVAQQALYGLERLRADVGLGSAYVGLPLNLLPIRPEDHMLTKILTQGQPTFENYTDGALSGWSATYYLRALSIYGLKEQAYRMATELEAGYAAGMHNGGNGTGHEFRSWDGIPCGYEGTLIGCFGPMYGIAIEQGNLRPTDPEWWPGEGNIG